MEVCTKADVHIEDISSITESSSGDNSKGLPINEQSNELDTGVKEGTDCGGTDDEQTDGEQIGNRKLSQQDNSSVVSDHKDYIDDKIEESYVTKDVLQSENESIPENEYDYLDGDVDAISLHGGQESDIRDKSETANITKGIRTLSTGGEVTPHYDMEQAMLNSGVGTRYKKNPTYAKSKEAEEIYHDTRSVRSVDTVVEDGNREYIEVDLQKISGMLGFSVTSVHGGRRKEQHFIKAIVAGGPAAKDGRMEVGDKVVEFNSVSLDGLPQETVIDLIRRSNTVRLRVEKGGATNHGVHNLIMQPYTTSKYVHGKGKIARLRKISIEDM